MLAIAIAGIAVVLRSDFGKDLTTKTDQQLYRRYLAYMKHSKIALDVNLGEWVKAQEEVTKTAPELENRGYDLTSLLDEESSAKFDGRSMDFSRARKRPS